MPAPCKACGGQTVVDDAGVVCIDCAEIAEPNRVVLASDSDFHLSTYEGWIPVAPHAVRTARGRYLGSEDKEARDGKHLDDMHHFIKNLAQAVFVSGTTERAYNLFEKAMKLGHYRFGRMARLVAAACISITLRSTSRPEMFAQLASLLGEKTTAVTRTFSSVLSLIKLDDLPPAESKSHLSVLHAHLYAALDGSIESDLPQSLISAIKPLPASSLSDTAGALSDLIAFSNPPSSIAHLPVAPTACAVMLWAIEAESRTSFSHLGEVAAFLGAKCGCKKAVVMNRYKVIQDELLERIEKIDSLDQYKQNGAGRAKVSRRLVVARGLKAVIEAEGECRRQRLVETRPPDDPDGSSNDVRPRKRRRIQALQQATQFLLNPLSGPLPPSFLTASRTLTLPTYILTSSGRRDTLPTRLQLLTVARGGVGTDEIADDELFEDEELERLMRSSDEVTEMRKIMGWPQGEVEEPVKEPPRQPRQRRSSTKEKPTTSSRIDDAAAAAYFDEKADYDFEELLQFDDEPGLLVEEDGDVTTMGLQGVLQEEGYVQDWEFND
ncbi:hypothetical protein FB45DRAFT_505136 [Roridomyces roridus]|uniref:B-related factor 1 n=1 Tax=Roridomyces roridus TaxID=1738132 RepID=A0AAD7BWH4_9AGAR|nr:hypothetical protein FB45DRAFT_505136 [Roridomyces roridus]